MPEQRDYLRYIVKGKVAIKTGDTDGRGLKGDLLDMSFTGMSLFLTEKIAPHTIVEIELYTELFEKPLTGKARVKVAKDSILDKLHGFRIGLEFIETDKVYLNGILNVIEGKICAEKRKRTQSGSSGVGIY